MSNKESKLIARLRELPSLLIAYSGGVDSAYLMHSAFLALGTKAEGVLADSPSLPRSEKVNAMSLAADRGWTVTVIQTDEMNNPDYTSNPTNRCYFCKQELFQQMEKHARTKGVAALAYGENADDLSDVRHGRQAADEFSILAPLREVGLTKSEIRELSEIAGLPTADKPAQPCLSSRIPNGKPVTVEALFQIEQGETILHQSGFRIVRLRHLGDDAKIQAAPEELDRLLDAKTQDRLRPLLTNLGFKSIIFDPNPYSGASLR